MSNISGPVFGTSPYSTRTDPATDKVQKTLEKKRVFSTFSPQKINFRTKGSEKILETCVRMRAQSFATNGRNKWSTFWSQSLLHFAAEKFEVFRDFPPPPNRQSSPPKLKLSPIVFEKNAPCLCQRLFFRAFYPAVFRHFSSPPETDQKTLFSDLFPSIGRLWAPLGGTTLSTKSTTYCG